MTSFTPENEPTVPLGILRHEEIRHGDHIACFWETAAEFAAGVAFLSVGLQGADHCVIFGYAEANERVCQVLTDQGFDVPALERAGRLTIVGGEKTGDATLGRLGSIFRAAVEHGAPFIRLLGNIGWSKEGWPDEQEILLFEGKVTGAAKQFPCAIVCMYDVGALSGRIILNGGLATHPITVCGNVMRVNPHHEEFDRFADRIRRTS